jgi:hypothetical protein
MTTTSLTLSEQFDQLCNTIKEWFKEQYRVWLARTWSEKLETIGWIIGIILAIAALATGVAQFGVAIGFILYPLYIFFTGHSFASAGRYAGKALDAYNSNKKLTHEERASAVGAIIGVVLSVVSLGIFCFDFNFVFDLGFIAKSAVHVVQQYLAPLFCLLIPAAVMQLTGKMASACTYIGREIDKLVRSEKKIESDIKEIAKPNDSTLTSTSTESLSSSHLLAKQLTCHISAPIILDAPKHSLQKDDSHHALKKQGLTAIGNYELTRKNQIGFFAKTFDYNKGLIRKNKYAKLLKHAETPLEIYIIFFALLGDHSGGTQLKKEIQNELGYENHSIHFILAVLKNLIRDNLNHDKTTLSDLNKNHIPNMIKWANNNRIDDYKNRPRWSSLSN